MFNKVIGLVTSPEIAIEACDIALVFGELEDFSDKELEICINDIINYRIDVLMGVLIPL